ncbi:endoribonuclease MazF [soil metagenome]
MVKRTYIPARGDIVWLEFDPQIGKEQSGKRPALVLSPTSYNQTTGLAIVCPITKQVKGYPFEVQTYGKKIAGVVLADHIKSLDWRQRKAQFVERCSAPMLEEVLAKLEALLSFQ